MAGSHGSRRAIITALAANFAIAVAKGVAAFFSGSGAMLAETVHSLADCGNQLLLMLGMRKARLPPSDDYPLGHGKEIYFWSFMVAVLLFSIGGMYSMYEGWHKLHAPEPLKQWGWSVGVLVFAIVAESWSTLAALKEASSERHGRSLWRWFHESRRAELIVIVGENVAAVLGLAFALVAVVATVLTGNPLWDALGTLAIGALLIVIAIFVAIEVKALLVGQGIDPTRKRQLQAFLHARPEVERIISLVTLQMGAEVLVSVQAVMVEQHDAVVLTRQITEVELALKEQFPEVRWSFFEPENKAYADSGDAQLV